MRDWQGKRWDVFFAGLQKDLKLWLFLLALLCAYRGIFIFTMREYMTAQAGLYDVLEAMWIGFRLSLKSAGLLALIGFVFCTLTNTALPRFKMDRLRLCLGAAYTFLLSVLLLARYPYYQEFHVTFNQNIYNTFKEDAGAMLVTAAQQYQLLERLAFVAVLTAALVWLLNRWLRGPVWRLPQRARRAWQVGTVLALPVFFLFIRFGGSFNYAHSVNWQNAGMTRDYFLNEAVLDDVQALYRAWNENKYMMTGLAEGIEQERVAEFAGRISRGAVDSAVLDDHFIRRAAGAKIAKPRHVFVVIGESYLQWPLSAQYEKLHIADGIKGIIARDNAYYSPNFIPIGAFTADTLNGLVTGMAVAGIYPAYQPETYRGVYGTAFAKQFKALGYKAIFWHGGYASSGRIKDLVLAQGFDEYVDCGDMDLERTNVWGAKDGLLLRGVEDRFDPDTPAVHVIMTVINHPPYNLDAAAEGFDRERTKAAIPAGLENDDDMLNMLGSYWYMDREISGFVNRMYEKYPDSLFVITGDHADRRTLMTPPSLYELYTIPFVLYGQGVTKDILPRRIAGNHLNIAPTLLELIAPPGYEYHSIFPSFTEGNYAATSHKVWITDRAMGRLSETAGETLPGREAEPVDFAAEYRRAHADMAMQRTLSWWRVAKGNAF